MTPEEIVARLLYRDGLMLILDKPAGYAVHKGPRGAEAAKAWRIISARCASACHARPRSRTGSTAIPPAAWCWGGTARRWPRWASCSNRARSARSIGRWWKAGPAGDEGRIDMPLGRRDDTRGWWMKPDPDGQPAVTTWKVLGRSILAPIPTTRWATPARLAPPLPLAGEGRGEGIQLEFAADPPPPLPQQGVYARLRRAMRGREQTAQAARHSVPMKSRAQSLHPSPGWRSSRSPAARINCACIARPWAGRSSATPFTEARRAPAVRRCICMRARSRSRSTRTSRRSRAMAPAPLHMQERLYACGWQGEVFSLVD